MANHITTTLLLTNKTQSLDYTNHEPSTHFNQISYQTHPQPNLTHDINTTKNQTNFK